MLDPRTLIGKDMFAKGTYLAAFINMAVTLPGGQVRPQASCVAPRPWPSPRPPAAPLQIGRIEGAFGKSGKFRVVFSEAVETRPGEEVRSAPALTPSRVDTHTPHHTQLRLRFKRYLFDAEKRMVQG